MCAEQLIEEGAMAFGRVLTYNEERLFGFIIPDKGDRDDDKVFFHIRKRCNIKNRSRIPLPGDEITYRMVYSERKRPEAIEWAFKEDAPGCDLGGGTNVNPRKHQMSRRGW